MSVAEQLCFSTPDLVAPPAVGHTDTSRHGSLNHQLPGWLSEFFKSQGELLNKELMAESVDSMSASVQSQIQRLASLEPPDATLINAAIARSAFDNKHKQDFATAVMRRIAAPAGDCRGCRR